MQGVLAQVIAAGHHLCIIQLGSCGIVAAEQVVFQLIQQAGVGLIDRIHCAVEHPLLIADAFQTVQAGTDAPEPCVAGGRCRLQPVNDLLRLAVLPAVVLQHGNRAFHTALKAADGVEVAHLVVQFPQHGAGLVKAQEYLPRQRQKKRCQAKTDLPFQGHPAPHAPILPLCDILPRIFRLIRPVRRQSESSINFLFRPILAHFRASAQYHP